MVGAKKEEKKKKEGAIHFWRLCLVSYFVFALTLCNPVYYMVSKIYYITIQFFSYVKYMHQFLCVLGTVGPAYGERRKSYCTRIIE